MGWDESMAKSLVSGPLERKLIIASAAQELQAAPPPTNTTSLLLSLSPFPSPNPQNKKTRIENVSLHNPRLRPPKLQIQPSQINRVHPVGVQDPPHDQLFQNACQVHVRDPLAPFDLLDVSLPGVHHVEEGAG